MKYQGDTETVLYDLKYKLGNATDITEQLLFSSVEEVLEDLKKRIVPFQSK